MPSAPAPLHLLIPDAVAAAPGGAPLPEPTAPAALDALLARLRPAASTELAPDSAATPFEIALARARHLPGEPGHLAWAALESGTAGTPCAWLRPCHWQLGLDDVQLIDPAQLALSEEESRALLATVQPLLAEDGVALRYIAPERWLAQGELFRGLTTWSMARALAQPLTRDLLALAPTEAQSAHLRRLQTELQMLLYTHPVNDAREARRGWPVNALWIDGAGALDPLPPPTPEVLVEPALSAVPPSASAEQRRAAWQTVGQGSLARLAAALEAGADAQLTLCGPQRALSWVPGRGLGFRISSLFQPQRWQDIRQKL